ncbi:MAG: glutamate synthase [Gemmatimonadetes bacterium]|nr:glutamate synthase [Gemmatimonadota bacterium]
MAILAPMPIATLVRRMLRELDAKESIFDLPTRKFVRGDPSHDYSVRFHSHVAATPFGPAAGPNTQLAQNIVLAWLAGGRILELKTVQLNDRLTIPRPCIDMQTVGYNVEWSQELTLEESLEEYVKAAMLIRILEASGQLALAPGFERTVFDMSVGYDLAGIRSERVQAFIAGMMDATAVVERLRRALPKELGPLRDLDFVTRLSDTLTLSTFHGCPPHEIEQIVEFLMRERHLACVVKLNPTLLGATALQALLTDALGYADLRVPGDAFAKDTQWEQAAAFMDRLDGTARALDLDVGVKLTNTLIVENHRHVFPKTEPAMYLSGAPLHVLAMHLVRRVRRTFGDRFPISFSAGIERANFPDAVALGLVPVTACTDLLQPGGYGRPLGYFDELKKRMDVVGAASVNEFIVRAYGADGPTELAAAKIRNTDLYVERATGDPRYAAATRRKVPRKIGRQLKLFDCLTCDKCIPVCPNDANFTFAMPSTPEVPLSEARQIGNFADLCNDCGNCDTFCPEDGGPYRLKPRFFVSSERWLADAPRDAILVERDAITGRFDGVEVRVTDETDAADGPYVPILRQLRDALLAPTEINYVNQSLVQ